MKGALMLMKEKQGYKEPILTLTLFDAGDVIATSNEQSGTLGEANGNGGGWTGS